MDVSRFCSTARLLIVAGKGGVGKTTVSAALARTAADAGLTPLIVELEGKSGLGAVFGARAALTYEEAELAHGVRARTLTPDQALIEYLEERGMRRISKRLTNTGALDVVSTAVPGIKDIVVLGKVKQLERESAADLIIVDAPAAGHAITFLMSARALLDAARVGPIRAQAQEVAALLSDASRCQVVFVTLPEETPVNEVVETAFALEDRVGIKLGPVVVNGVVPLVEGLDRSVAGAANGLRDAAEFRLARMRLQQEQIARLREALPLAQLPFLFTPEIGPTELDALARAMKSEIEALPS